MSKSPPSPALGEGWGQGGELTALPSAFSAIRREDP